MTKTIKPWGNSYGVLLTKAELEQLGLRPGQEVEMQITACGAAKRDLSELPELHLGGRWTPNAIDHALESEAAEEQDARRGQ